MKIIEVRNLRQIVADKGKVVRRVSNKDSVFTCCGLLSNETLDDFEELTQEDFQAEQDAAKVAEEYAAKVEQLIRERYSVSAELAILRQRDSKPEEFAAYNAYAEECKAKAKG